MTDGEGADDWCQAKKLRGKGERGKKYDLREMQRRGLFNTL